MPSSGAQVPRPAAAPWEAGLRVVLVAAHEWRSYRRIRLQALADSPLAFGSTLELERQLPESAWRSRLTPGSQRWTWTARTSRGWLGLVSAVRDGEEELELVSMWVDPRARRRGLARILIAEVVARHCQLGTKRLCLWVAEDNPGARDCYRSCGFSPTGRRQPFPRDPTRLEVQMRWRE